MHPFRLERYPRESDYHFRKRLTSHYSDLPEAFHLFRIRWMCFGHLTLSKAGSTEKVRLDMFVAALRRVCRSNRLYFPTLFWAVRQEQGSRDDLFPHLHFVLAGIPERVIPRQFCTLFEAAWRRQGGGLSRIVPYDRTRDGAGYIAKTQANDSGLDCELMFSEALLLWLKRIVKEREASRTRTLQFRAK